MNNRKRNIGIGLFFGALFISSAIIAEQRKSPKGVASYRDQAISKAKAKPEKETCTKEAWICATRRHSITMRWGCEDAIKAGLKDPRSYQVNDVGYWPSMDVDPALVMVKIDYNAKNGFGGSVRGNAVCHADASGNILSAKYL